MGKAEHRPLVGDGPIVGVIGVAEPPRACKSLANTDACASLVSEASAVIGCPIPVAPFCLISALRKKKWCLAMDLVIDNAIAGYTMIPLCNRRSIARRPF
jgi:hypothetical protein